MRIDVLTLFPEMFGPVLSTSIPGRAAQAIAAVHDPSNVRQPVVSYHIHNIRDYTQDKHEKVDKPPYGGGPGMVMQCQPIWDAVQAVQAEDVSLPTRVLLTPQGEPLKQAKVQELSQKPRLMLIAGHYEGLDERVIEALREAPAGLEEISLGDYVLSGGELVALVLIDAVVRLLPGVLGDADSATDESFSQSMEGLLDYPHYTRPPVWEGRAIPDVLLSGHHAQIAAWRHEQARKRTEERRPDLLK